jgi:hypothetical protein
MHKMQTAQATAFLRRRSAAQACYCAVPRSCHGPLSTGGLLRRQELTQRWLGGPGVSCHVRLCVLHLSRSQTPISIVSQMATVCLHTPGHDLIFQAVHNASHVLCSITGTHCLLARLIKLYMQLSCDALTSSSHQYSCSKSCTGYCQTGFQLRPCRRCRACPLTSHASHVKTLKTRLRPLGWQW